jgi:type VI secretion system protein ImpL
MRADVDLPDGTRTEAVVRGAFTRRAWEDPRPGCTGDVCSIKQMLETPDSGVLGESWVLGREVATSDEAIAEEMIRLRSRYFRAYIEEWQQFIRSLRVRSPDGNEQSLADLQDLTRGDPPVLGRYVSRVAWNADLCPPPPPAETEGQAAERGFLDIVEQRMRRSEAGRILLQVAGAGGTEEAPDVDERILFCENVKDAFRGFTTFAVPEQLAEGEEPPPMGLDVYQEQLRSVRDALQTYMDTPEDPEALLNALQEARTRVRALIEEQEVGWRPRFEAILWPPIDGSGNSSTRGLAMGAGRSWCAEVYRPWHRNLRGRYPFNESGLDVPLADFADFYKPEGGTLWTFYDEVLASMIERDGDQFQFSRQLGRQGHFRPETLRHLGRAQEISSAFFPPGAEDPTVEVDVRIRPTPEVEQIRFSIGEAEIEYHNGPEEWNRMTWPGETPEAGAFIEVRGSGLHERIEQDGEWGLYRILERGSVTEYQPGSSVFQVTWRLRTHDIDIKIDFRPVRGESPFFGVRGRNRDGRLMQPTRADQVTTPREIVTRARLCNIQS